MLTQKVLRICCAMCAAEKREQEAAKVEARAALELGPGSVGPLAASLNDIFSLILRKKGNDQGVSKLQHMWCFVLK